MKSEGIKKCCICGKRIIGYGNNPWPVVEKQNAECCDDCNSTEVIPARIARMCRREE